MNPFIQGMEMGTRQALANELQETLDFILHNAVHRGGIPGLWQW